jgi:uncharacterized OsmC-like protein
VWQRGAREPNRIGMFEVRVTLPEALPTRYAEAIQRVARSCPAHHTLVEGAEVQISVESPALTA